jgi:serine/threonine protein kinase
VHDVVIADDAPWIVMQLVAGRSLEEHLREHGPLSIDNAAKVAGTVLRALAAAHAAGIVHRDVKPGNVLLADDGRVLLTDFGIAQHQDDSSLTVTGAVIGSAEYLAPERARAGEAGPASDLFSLGATLYHAVEGVSPFRRDTPTATMTAVLFDQPAPPRNAGRLAPLLARLLAKEPGQRPSVEAALAMLGGRGGDTGGSGAGVRATRDMTNAAPTDASQHPTQVPQRVYLAGNTPQVATQPRYATPPKPGNGSKIALAVGAVVVVSVLTTLGITQLTRSGSPSAGPTTSSRSQSGTTSGTTPGTSAMTTDSQTTTSGSTPPNPGPKAGCAEASRDLTAFNTSNPAGHGGKDFQISADHDFASELSSDADLATDPTVKAAIQSEADAWNKFADYYAASDTSGMETTIPETTRALVAVNKACNG